MATSTPQKAIDKPFGEVVFSTNEMIKVQCYKDGELDTSLKQSIVQGSTVRVSSYDNSFLAYGLIARINNTSLDHIHKPSALGLSPQELEHLQPQVFDLLRKELDIYLFAYKEEGKEIVNQSPLKPLMIDDFVCKTTDKEVLGLTESFSNLISLIKKNQLKIDLLVDLIILGYKLRNSDYNYLLKAGQELSLAFSDDIDSLMQTLKRLSQSRK